jgi:F-box and WD-40 domain protein CDC4
MSLHQRVLENEPNRPLSAMALDFRAGSSSMMDYGEDTASPDVDMQDAGPSTAPLQGGNKTFFHDD